MSPYKVKPHWDERIMNDDWSACLKSVSQIRSPRGVLAHCIIDHNMDRFRVWFVFRCFSDWMQENMPNCQYASDDRDGFPRNNKWFCTHMEQGDDVWGLELDHNKEPIVRFARKESAMLFKLAYG